MNETPDAPAEALMPPCSLHQRFTPGSWEYHVARLLQHVQETRELLREDLQEISEPLTALLTHGQAFSQEQRALQHAVEEDYQQAMQVIDQALTRMLRHFPAEIELLSQLQREHLSQTGDLSKELLACSQEEQAAETALP